MDEEPAPRAPEVIGALGLCTGSVRRGLSGRRPVGPVRPAWGHEHHQRRPARTRSRALAAGRSAAVRRLPRPRGSRVRHDRPARRRRVRHRGHARPLVAARRPRRHCSAAGSRRCRASGSCPDSSRRWPLSADSSSRRGPRVLERRYGQDQLLAAHRWFGIVTVVTVVVHAVDGHAGPGARPRAARSSAAWSTCSPTRRGWSPPRSARCSCSSSGCRPGDGCAGCIPYETWYFVHLTGYLAVLLGFGHQLTLGADFATDTLRVLVVDGPVRDGRPSLITYARLGDLVRSLTRRFYVTAVSREANGIGSLHVSGPGLRRLRVAGGQFFNVRALTRGPVVAGAPLLGVRGTDDGRAALHDQGAGRGLVRACCGCDPGTRLVLEGPYGVFTAEQAEGAPVVLVAGGVGISPDPRAARGLRSAPAAGRHRARARRGRRRPPARARADGRRPQRHPARPGRSAALVQPARSVLARGRCAPGSRISPAGTCSSAVRPRWSPPS